MHQRKPWLICIMLVFSLLLLFGCDKEQTNDDQSDADTYQKIEEKNKVLSLLQEKDTKGIVYSQLDMVGGDVGHLSYFLNDQGRVESIIQWNDSWGYSTETMSLSMENDSVTMNLSGEIQPEVSLNDFSLFAAKGDYEALKTDDNGNLLTVSKVEADEEMVENYKDLWDISLGDYMVSKSVIDAESLILDRTDYYITDADGLEKEYIAIGVVRKIDTPEMPVMIQNLLDGETHHVTICLSDGTKREFDVPISAVVTCSVSEGEALYEDAEGEKSYAFPEKPLTEDITVYCHKK